MTIQSACLAPLIEDLVTEDLVIEDLSRPKCPRCDSVLLVAEESRFDVEGRVDHAWACDICGHAFATSVRLWPR